jgi:hypothetical protein
MANGWKIFNLQAQGEEHMIIKAMKEALNALHLVKKNYFNFWEKISPDDSIWNDIAASDAEISRVIEEFIEAIRVYESSPPEAITEAEKIAFAFGWFKALELQGSRSLVMRRSVTPDENTEGYRLFDHATEAEEFLKSIVDKFPRDKYKTQAEGTMITDYGKPITYVVRWMIWGSHE